MFPWRVCVMRVTVPMRSSQEAEDNRIMGMIETPFNQLDVYFRGGLRASKADPVRVDAGGSKKDADIIIPLSKLPKVRGQVALKSTSEPPVVANVELLYADTLEIVRTVIEPNGVFEFFNIPEETPPSAQLREIPKVLRRIFLAARSVTDLPQRSSRHTTTTSISLRRAASSISSRRCRCAAPEPTSFTCMAMVQPRRAAWSRMVWFA